MELLINKLKAKNKKTHKHAERAKSAKDELGRRQFVLRPRVDDMQLNLEQKKLM